MWEMETNQGEVENEAPKNDDYARCHSGESPQAEASAETSPHMHIYAPSSNVDESLLPLPVWMRESSKTFHWRWVPFRIRQACRSIVQWTKGPDPPKVQKITPIMPAIQEAPVQMIERYLPKQRHKALGLGCLYGCWILIFSFMLVHSNSAGKIEGYGKPEPIWCGASYW